MDAIMNFDNSTKCDLFTVSAMTLTCLTYLFQVYGKSEAQLFKECARHLVYDFYTRECLEASTIQFSDRENVEERATLTLINSYIMPLIAIPALIANLFVLMALKDRNQKTVATEPLVNMVICSMLLILSPLLFNIYWYHFGIINLYNQTIFTCYFHKITLHTLPLVFNTLVSFFTIQLGVQRFVALQHPLAAMKWCTEERTRRHTRMVLTLGLITYIVAYFPDTRVIYHFCLDISGEKETGDFHWVSRCFTGYPTYTRAIGVDMLNSVVDLYRISIVSLPIPILITITWHLVIALRDYQAPNPRLDLAYPTCKRHMSMNAATRDTTIFHVGVAITYLIIRIPVAGIILIHRCRDFLNLANEPFFQSPSLFHVLNLGMTTLHPLSFALYALSSSKIRLSLKLLFSGKSFAEYKEQRRQRKIVKKLQAEKKAETEATAVEGLRSRTHKPQTSSDSFHKATSTNIMSKGPFTGSDDETITFIDCSD